MAGMERVDQNDREDEGILEGAGADEETGTVAFETAGEAPPCVE